MPCFVRKVIIILSLFCFSFCYADITLPTPQTKDGMSLFESLKKRSSTSGGGFPAGQVSDNELSTVLWAASGLNRGKSGWTVPMANGNSPYVRIYVASEKGTFLYEWEGHYLKEINNKDIRADIGLQNFTRRAAYSLIFVSDASAFTGINPEQITNFSYTAVGAMSQNAYLAAAALKLSARYIHSIKPEVISQELQLPEGSKPLGMLLLGK
ncbi:SagB/ThcOx family dehydrogenase [Gilliamella sp. Pra-s65]|uniref:nitroreductase family protein n=1 Tax=unclassified Gilliamella TaxID=2685620 RepID=UPI00132258FB|nr:MULTISPECIES: nitroreductase family protein [unclassified Gilliamella]MWN31412.1 SagB/ThcOx family dehydrogenase [Gilliamella sp. Pra-s60]MWN89653.1 SagB/ThcOx family dehydrogenase [Gilliamella sp. Pra-s65]MWP28980.1 SagB/ThcOx family dehydrogenase [Gilliamella sp. Pra-s54]MWP46224.1 SagB/ThcOx family dehydrogenase [Gilliamella sp. Pas-s27]MWP72661.1 SagB/ThcOx family dehydrogenase [Gilliamella sp. Pra-s52]